MFKQLPLQKKPTLNDELNQVLSALDAKFDSLELVPDPGSKEIYIQMRHLKHMCKKFQRKNSNITLCLNEFCTKIPKFSLRGATAGSSVNQCQVGVRSGKWTLPGSSSEYEQRIIHGSCRYSHQFVRITVNFCHT